jgi:hypothetical protein
LRNTIIHLIDQSSAGHTHGELHGRLQLRVYDTLHDLVSAREISRADIERLYLYVSARPERAEAQIAKRHRLIAQPPRIGPLPDAAAIIEVLLAVIHSRRASIEAIAAFLRAQGKAITQEQVEAVWIHYELGKKTPASGRLRQ